MVTYGLIAAIVLLALAGLYARARVQQIDAREEYRNDFFDAANVLAEREDTPETPLSVVEFLAERVGKRRAPYEMMYFLIHGDARRSANEPAEKLRQLRQDLADMPEELRQQFGKAVAAGSMAITLNSLIVGWLIRRIAMYAVYKRNKRKYDGTDDAGTIAGGWALT
ncbi:hypothetical protein [Ferruginivarius sediminum]|uniref:Uncharacterized protein n=1 Tax=Ferruginivarius sediminum TaxID=2661937 RepID=A0A369T573_9PROT|nr:hypothetical protein [Ferruginivarius sediminum]RDD60491.1 hypothetical protein DRB17_17995 [Ferruginivarius sediminum]